MSHINGRSPLKSLCVVILMGTVKDGSWIVSVSLVNLIETFNLSVSDSHRLILNNKPGAVAGLIVEFFSFFHSKNRFQEFQQYLEGQLMKS